MWNDRSRCIPVAFAFLALTASACAQTPPGSDDETLPPPDTIEDIGYAVDIAPGSPEFEVLPAAAQTLLLANPDTQAAVIDGRVAALYGAPLATGATAAQAEQAFWTAHADAFGISNLDVTGTRSHDVGFGRLTVFAYQQRMDGLPVEFATARLIVNHSDGNDVTFVSGRFVHGPPDGMSDMFVTPENAIGIVAGSPSFSYFQNWSNPELVVFAGTPEAFGWPRAGHPVKAWKFQADFEAAQTPFQAVTFYVDAASGEIVHVSRDTWNADLFGHVRARATPVVRLNQQTQQYEPWTGPYDPSDSQSLVNDIAVPEIRVRVSPAGTPSDFTDFTGEFRIPDWTGGETDMTTTVDEGQWFDVDPGIGSPLSDSESVTPNTDESLLLNYVSPNRETTAQVNALIYATLSRKFYVDRMTFLGLDYPLKLRTSTGADEFACNAGYARERISFDQSHEIAGGLCPDSAFSAVVAHEYGHFVHNQLGAFGGAFGEGFGDSGMLLTFDDTIYGRGFPSGGGTRDYSPGQTEVTYPCTEGFPHACGMVLGGLWRDIREQLSQKFYPTAPMAEAVALPFTRDLFVDWAQVTNGGYGNESAHPLTVQEIYAVAAPLAVQYGFTFTTQVQPRICEAAFQHGLAVHMFPGPLCVAKPVPTGAGPFISFRPAQIIYVNGAGVNPYGIAVSKVDGDTLFDVVLACERSTDPVNPGTGRVLVYWGASSSPSSYSFNATPTSIAVEQNGQPTKLALADFDNDGHTDIAVTLAGTTGGGLNRVQILENNNGDRTFTARAPMTPIITIQGVDHDILRPIGVAAGDWDNDGDMDLAVAGYVQILSTQYATLGLFWNTGGFTFSRTGERTPLGGDYETGRTFDLAAWLEDANGGSGNHSYMFGMTNSNLSRLHFFRGTLGSQTLTPFSIDGIVSESLTPITINGDALIDIAAVQSQGSTTCWFPRTSAMELASFVVNDQAGTTANPRSVAAGRITKSIVAGGTLAADSQADLIVASIPGTGGTPLYEFVISIFPHQPTGSPPRYWATQHHLSVSPNPHDRPFPRQALAIDINADGLDDILTANRGLGGIAADAYEGFTLRLSRGQ